MHLCAISGESLQSTLLLFRKPQSFALCWTWKESAYKTAEPELILAAAGHLHPDQWWKIHGDNKEIKGIAEFYALFCAYSSLEFKWNLVWDPGGFLWLELPFLSIRKLKLGDNPSYLEFGERHIQQCNWKAKSWARETELALSHKMNAMY